MSIDRFVALEKQTYPQNTDEFTVHYHRLIADGEKNKANDRRTEWSKKAGKAPIPEQDHKLLWQMIASPAIDLAYLPYASWFIQFTFALAKPYISKDDNPFYIIDNPIVRDKVFRLPMVRSTSWKGNLYSALWQLGHDKKQNDEQMQRLFGEIRGKEGGQAGRLFFYPTFFTKTDLEIFNPHDRKRRVGKNPILFECVPTGAKGIFSLLYVPFDLIGKEEAAIRNQALEDLQLAAEGLQAMLTIYGFGAKTTSGYGVAEEKLEGTLLINLPDIPPIPECQDAASPACESPEEAFWKYLDESGQVKREFKGSGEGGLMSNSEYKAQGQSLGGGSLSEFRRFRSWYAQHGERWRSSLATPELASSESSPVSKFTIRTLSRLSQVARHVAGELRRGDQA